MGDNMDRIKILQELIKQNNGYLLTSMAIDKGITKPYLAKYVKENGMEKVASHCTDSLEHLNILHIERRCPLTVCRQDTR